MFRAFIIHLLFFILVVPMYSQTKRYDFVFEDCNLKVYLPTNYKVKHSPNKSAKITIPDIGKVYIYAEIPALFGYYLIDDFLYVNIDTVGIEGMIKEKYINSKRNFSSTYISKEIKKEKEKRIKIAQSLIDTFAVYHPKFETKGLLYKNYNTHITKEEYYYRIILDTRYGVGEDMTHYIFIDFYTNKTLSQKDLNIYINSWIKNIELTHYTVFKGGTRKKIIHDDRKPFFEGTFYINKIKKRNKKVDSLEKSFDREYKGDTLQQQIIEDGIITMLKTESFIHHRNIIDLDNNSFYISVYCLNTVQIKNNSSSDTEDNGTPIKESANIHFTYILDIEEGFLLHIPNQYNNLEQYTRNYIKKVIENLNEKGVYYGSFSFNLRSKTDTCITYQLSKNKFIDFYFFTIKNKYMSIYKIVETEKKKNELSNSIENIIKSLDIIPKNK